MLCRNDEDLRLRPLQSRCMDHACDPRSGPRRCAQRLRLPAGMRIRLSHPCCSGRPGGSDHEGRFHASTDLCGRPIRLSGLILNRNKPKLKISRSPFPLRGHNPSIRNVTLSSGVIWQGVGARIVQCRRVHVGCNLNDRCAPVMPFTHNSRRPHRIGNMKFEVTNWLEYEAGLRPCGSLTPVGNIGSPVQMASAETQDTWRPASLFLIWRSRHVVLQLTRKTLTLTFSTR